MPEAKPTLSPKFPFQLQQISAPFRIHYNPSTMPSICSSSANISLPKFLQPLFYSEFAPQLRTPATRPLSRLPLPRHHLSSRRTITTVSIDSIPVTSAQKAPTPSQNEPSGIRDSSNAASQSLNDRTSTQATTSTASSPSTPRTKTKPKTHSGQKPRDRDTKRSAPRDRTDIGIQTNKKREEWQIQKEALKRKFPTGWSPPKKLSPDAIEGIRHLNSVAPDQFTTDFLADEFKVSAEAVRRILKSKWRPSATEMESRRKRWDNRADRIWGHMSELGLRPKRPDSVSDAATILYDQNKKGKASGDSS
ncbi:hypothetical protein BJX76DRAFT_325333 [Aspergillus varians]